MKMTAIPFAFYSHSTSFPWPSSLLLYQFHECHWLAIIPEHQTKKTNNNQTFLVISRQKSCIIFKGLCLFTLKRQ